MQNTTLKGDTNFHQKLFLYYYYNEATTFMLSMSDIIYINFVSFSSYHHCNLIFNQRHHVIFLFTLGLYFYIFISFKIVLIQQKYQKQTLTTPLSSSLPFCYHHLSYQICSSDHEDQRTSNHCPHLLLWQDGVYWS